MADYDIAAGSTPAGLNALLAQVYAQRAARDHLFRGSMTTTDPIDATATYDLQNAPVLRLSGPTQAEWENAYGADPTQPLPPPPDSHAVTVTMAGLNVSLEMGGVTRETTGTVQAFGVVTATGTKVTIDLIAVGVDETEFSLLDKIAVNQMIIPEVLDMAQKMLGSIALPQLPELGALTFAPLALDVSPGGVVIATSRTTAPPPDLAGFAWPGAPLFVLATLAAMNAGIAQMVSPKYEQEDTSGSDAFTAAGRVTATDLAVTLSVAGSDVRIAIAGTFGAYGELSGTGVGITKAVMCPIGAAADAIADPDNWDKVISQFELVYKPGPLPIVVGASAAPPSGAPPQQRITFDADAAAVPSDLSLLVKPEWSGSVTGTVLAAAASAFVDLISLTFQNTIILIVKAVLSAEGHISLSLPTHDMTQKVKLNDDVTLNVQLLAAPGPALKPVGTDQLVQPLTATIS